MRPQLLLFLTGLFVWSTLLFSQQPATTGSIEGVVVRSDTGRPIAGAVVTLSSSNLPLVRGRGARTMRDGLVRSDFPMVFGSLPPATTGADGRFEFKDLKAGTYRLAAKGVAFIPQEYGQATVSAQGKPLYLAEGQALRNVAVPLIPENFVSGRVFDEKGQPAAGATVDLFRAVFDEEGKGYRLVQEAIVDDQGKYRLFGVPPGRYYLGAGTLDPAVAPSDSRVKTGSLYSAVYHPRAASLDDAAAIEVRAGREESVDMTVKRQTQPRSIRGRVIDATTGKPPAEVQATLYWTGFNSGISRGLPPNYNPLTGDFELRNLHPGDFDLSFAPPFVASKSFGLSSLTPETQLEMDLEYSAMRRTILPIHLRDADIEGLVFNISKANTTTGRFVVEGSEAAVPGINRARVAMSLKGVGINEAAVVLPPAADGRFEVHGLRDGEYRVAISGIPDGFYVKSIGYGGEDVTGKSLKASDPVKTIEVTLRPGAIQVTGTVKDAKAQLASGAQVVLIAAERGRSKDVLALTDQSGRFVLPNISPGEYRLYAWDSIEEGAYYDPEFMKAYQEQGQAVRVVEGANQNLDVKLIH